MYIYISYEKKRQYLSWICSIWAKKSMLNIWLAKCSACFLLRNYINFSQNHDNSASLSFGNYIFGKYCFEVSLVMITFLMRIHVHYPLLFSSSDNVWDVTFPISCAEQWYTHTHSREWLMGKSLIKTEMKSIDEVNCWIFWQFSLVIFLIHTREWLLFINI